MVGTLRFAHPTARPEGLTAICRRAIEQWVPDQVPPAGKPKMPVRLDRSSADFDRRFADFLAVKREAAADIEAATRAIVDDVAARGDSALIEATRKFDRLEVRAGGVAVSPARGGGA